MSMKKTLAVLIMFCWSSASSQSNKFYIYETDTGKLFYDADGNGSGKSKQIALIENKASLTYADFVAL